MVGNFVIAVYSKEGPITKLKVSCNAYHLDGDIQQSPQMDTWYDEHHRRVCVALSELEQSLIALADARRGSK